MGAEGGVRGDAPPARPAANSCTEVSMLSSVDR